MAEEVWKAFTSPSGLSASYLSTAFSSVIQGNTKLLELKYKTDGKDDDKNDNKDSTKTLTKRMARRMTREMARRMARELIVHAATKAVDPNKLGSASPTSAKLGATAIHGYTVVVVVML
jgi:hypothetical protein